jgi:hypothetical protein
MFDHRRQILGLGCAGHESAGVGAQLKDRTVGKEAGIGDEDDPRIRVAVACIISDRDGAAIVEDHVENDDRVVVPGQHIDGGVLIQSQVRGMSVASQVALPHFTQRGFVFNNQYIHYGNTACRREVKFIQNLFAGNNKQLTSE